MVGAIQTATLARHFGPFPECRNSRWGKYTTKKFKPHLFNFGCFFKDERQRLMRRNIVRYAVLAYVITLQRVSLRVKKRFPTWQHVVDSGECF